MQISSFPPLSSFPKEPQQGHHDFIFGKHYLWLHWSHGSIFFNFVTFVLIFISSLFSGFYSSFSPSKIFHMVSTQLFNFLLSNTVFNAQFISQVTLQLCFLTTFDIIISIFISSFTRYLEEFQVNKSIGIFRSPWAFISTLKCP